MKRLLFVLAWLAVESTLYGQRQDIVMPKEKASNLNIAEENRGYWCAIDLGGGSTVMENMKNVAMVGASFTNGYRLNQYLKVGLGLGVLYYPNHVNVRDTKNHLSMPIFLNIRGNILSDEIRHTLPYWSVNAGTSIPDGLFLTPSVGLRIGEKRLALLLSLGYTLRHLKSFPDRTQNYSGVLLKLGYEF